MKQKTPTHERGVLLQSPVPLLVWVRHRVAPIR